MIHEQPNWIDGDLLALDGGAKHVDRRTVVIVPGRDQLVAVVVFPRHENAVEDGQYRSRSLYEK